MFGFSQFIRNYLELKEKENDELITDYNDQLLDMEEKASRLTFTEAIQETTQKIQEESSAGFIGRNDIDDSVFLTKKFTNRLEGIKQSNETFLMTVQFDVHKLSKEKQQIYEDGFKKLLILREKKLQLATDDGPIDREAYQLKAITGMKL